MIPVSQCLFLVLFITLKQAQEGTMNLTGVLVQRERVFNHLSLGLFHDINCPLSEAAVGLDGNNKGALRSLLL